MDTDAKEQPSSGRPDAGDGHLHEVRASAGGPDVADLTPAQAAALEAFKKAHPGEEVGWGYSD